jgi:hypothetical protein
MILQGQLTAGTTTGHVSSFEVAATGSETVTDNCQVGGGLASLGCTDVSSMTAAGFPWTAHASSTQTIAITTGTIQVHIHGGFFCPKTIQITPGTAHVTTSTANTWTEGQFSGTLQADPSIGSAQNVTISGTGTVTPASQLGVS